MGVPTSLFQQARKMRCTIFALSLAIVYASASPIADSVVPEDSYYAVDDDLSEAQQKINQMTAAGASDKDCRKLVTETRKDVQTNVDSCQKIVDAMPKGEHCVNLGQANVKAATEAKSKADKHLVTTTTEVTKASSAEVHFESRAFSTLTEGKCASFYTSGGYTAAKAIYTAAVTARTKAKGEAEEAAKALTAAIAAAAKEKLDCECKTRADHKKAFATHGAADAANQKAWNFACKVECVLDGKTTCTCSAAPMCKAAKLTAAVNSAMCVAAKKKDDCPVGYTQVGTKTKNNDYGGACLGQTFGKTMEQCEGDCNTKKGCVSFMYGGPAQMKHKAGKCELCNHKKPNNSWGSDFVFCRRD